LIRTVALKCAPVAVVKMDGGRTPLLRGFQTNTVNFNAPNNWVADSSKNLQNPFGNNIYTILNIICIHIYDYTYIYIC
jgi:hypothetical protein